MTKLAVVLFNLGGPDGPASVRPFLFNLFNDPAIIRAPGPVRWLLAQLISRRRAPVATEIYGRIGGGSPILANTQVQAAALSRALADVGTVRVFTVMRYWHPRAAQVAAEVVAWQPDQVVLLPLYPQFSTTTTASSLAEWSVAAGAAGLAVPTATICCYPAESGFVAALADLIRPALAQAGAPARVLFTAHGLPQRVVDSGDPYQWQVEQTCAAIVGKLAIGGLDWRICYQSRVGPLKWIGPSTEEEIHRAGHDRVPIVLVPVAFVSEHSETLVELDITYRDLARAAGVPGFARVPTVDAHREFIAGLSRMVRAAVARGAAMQSGAGTRLCPANRQCCAMAAA